MYFLEINDVLIGNQFGFRRSHSSYMFFLVMINELSQALGTGEHVVGIFLDFYKAFDNINHSILLKKLHHYNIKWNALEWFESNLSGRQQYVSYNGFSSSTKYIKCGVPPGSILGPLLYMVYIKDLQRVCISSTPILFAEDTYLFYKKPDQSILEDQINNEQKHASLWLKVN